MELAEVSREPFKVPIWVPSVIAIAFSLGFIATVCLGQSLRMSIIATIGLASGASLLFCPIEQGIYFFFVYLLFDGFLKINSGYNPVMHVALDVLVILLAVRSAISRSDEGFYKVFKTPHFPFFLIFSSWIVIQYINPFGLGLIPSIAGTKVYISALAVFYLVYHHIPKNRVQQLLAFLLLLGVIEGVAATVEYLWLQQWVTAFHPLYRLMIETYFAGVFYRPFGTTALPGGPCVWMFLTAPVCGYFLISPNVKRKFKALAWVYLVFAIPTLIFCQVRTAVLVTGACFVLIAFHPAKGIGKRIATTAIAGALVFGFINFYFNSNVSEKYGWVKGLSSDQRQALTERFSTLKSLDTYENSRQGAVASIVELSALSFNGIGLSRVGAASEPWMALIKEDPYFGPHWSFADNIFRAIFTELGIFGLVSWGLLVVVVIYRLFSSSVSAHLSLKSDSLFIWVCGCAGLIFVLSGLGSEGILYNPVSSILWTYLSLGTKEVFDVA